jgi:hypothetical protein
LGGLQSFGALFDGELDALSLIQALIALTLNSSVMDEYVPGVLPCYETITFACAYPPIEACVR